jgi:hypothetical protein
MLYFSIMLHYHKMSSFSNVTDLHATIFIVFLLYIHHYMFRPFIFLLLVVTFIRFALSYRFYLVLAEMPSVAQVDHRTKCVSLVAISLSQNFETRKQASKEIYPQNGPQRKYHPIVVVTKKQT